jgi:polar amino acid transport system permease protein
MKKIIQLFVHDGGLKNSQPPGHKKILNYIILFSVLTGVLVFSFYRLDYSPRWSVIWKYRSKFLNGFVMTLVISVFSLTLSLMLGTFFAISRNSKILLLRYLSKVYVEIIRGTPLLVQIFVFFYIIGTAFRVEDRYLNGVIILSVFSGAYVTEIIRAGLESIEKSQLESARSLGFSKSDTYRFIIIPQIIKRIMPPLAGQFVSLIKDSSLLSVIAVNEFTKNYQEVDSLTFAIIENLTVLSIGYLILTIPISYWTRKLERKYTDEA